MSGLPWFPVDSGIPSHDKVLALVSDASEDRFADFTLYVCALGWSVLHETDGLIWPAVLPFVHRPETAKLLIAYGLWEDDGGSGSWRIHNFAKCQPTRAVTAATRKAQSEGGKKGNAKRWAPGPGTGGHAMIPDTSRSCRSVIPIAVSDSGERFGGASRWGQWHEQYEQCERTLEPLTSPTAAALRNARTRTPGGADRG